MVTKTDFVQLLAERYDITKKSATEMYENVFDTFADLVSSGDEVAIPNLGRVKINERAARVAKNPRTGDKVEVTAKKVPKFQFSKNIKEAVSQL